MTDAETACGLPAPLMTIPQVAGQLNVSIRTVYNLIEANELQHHKLGTARNSGSRVTTESFLAYLSRTRVQGGSLDVPEGASDSTGEDPE